MRTALAWVVVGGVLAAGCGGGSDSSDGGGGGGGSSSPQQSAGDEQYIDPFQDEDRVACLSKSELQRKIDRIASRVQNPERKQRAIHAVRERAC